MKCLPPFTILPTVQVVATHHSRSGKLDYLIASILRLISLPSSFRRWGM